MNLDDQNKYPGAIAMSTIKDFSGATTAVGGHNSGAYQLNGNLEQFSYNAKELTPTETTDIYNKGKGKGNGVKYNYDSMGRLKDRVISTGTLANPSLKASYEYTPGKGVGDKTTTTTQIKSIDNNGKKIEYTHDKNANIETITEDGKVIKYYYNELNELIREDNKVLNKTITYSYDFGGNIKAKVEYPHTTEALGSADKTYSYGYDATWKDKLTSFDGKVITYDAIGNPLGYNGYTYTWENGRQLAGMTGNGKTITFKYNDAGIRTQKTVNGVTTTYHLVGDKVTYEENTTDKVYFTYDSSDDLISMNLSIKNPDGTWRAGVEYYYIRNAQGDIIGLYDANGTQVVSYSYDSWGRFINVDAIGGRVGTLLSHNLFAYSMNNPVNLSDPSGHFSKWISSGIEMLAGAAMVMAGIAMFSVSPIVGITIAVSVSAFKVPTPQVITKFRVSTLTNTAFNLVKNNINGYKGLKNIFSTGYNINYTKLAIAGNSIRGYVDKFIKIFDGREQ